MLSLTHITEAELRRFYYLEGEISGRSKNINMLNGVQQDYVDSCIINQFIICNDALCKNKLELYIKENLPKLEVEYDKIVKKNQIDKKYEKYIIDKLLNMDETREIKNRVLYKFKIPLYEYYHKLHPSIKSRFGFSSFEVEPDFQYPYIILMTREQYIDKFMPLDRTLKFFQEDKIYCEDIRYYKIETSKGKKYKIYKKIILTREQLNKHIAKNKKKFNDKVDKICDNIQNEINLLCLS